MSNASSSPNASPRDAAATPALKLLARANPETASVPTRVAAGVGHLLWGIQATATRPNLLLLSAVVVVANLVIYAALFYVGFLYSDDVSRWLAAWAPDWLRWDWAETVMQVLLLILWAIICVFLAITVASVVTAPLLDMLSERAERLLTGEVHPLPLQLWPTIYELAAGLFFAVFGVASGLIATVLLFWLPVIGQFVPFAIGGLFVALSFVAPAAIRHKLSIGERVAMIRENKALLLGFGVPASLFPFLLVPLLTPALVVGGTRLYLVLAASGRVPTQITSGQLARLRGDA